MEPNQSNQVTSVKHHLCTVTSFSKFLALILFIALPFLGFWVGRHYPLTSDTTLIQSSTEEVVVDETENIAEVETITTNTPTKTQTNTNTAVAPTGPTVVEAYITEATLSTISVDYIAIYKDKAAINQMIADGLCPASEPKKCSLTNGVYYRNTDPTIRTYPLSPNVDVRTWTGTEYPLSKIVNEPHTQTPYSITISGGLVTQIKEIYRP